MAKAGMANLRLPDIFKRFQIKVCSLASYFSPQSSVIGRFHTDENNKGNRKMVNSTDRFKKSSTL